MLARVPFGDALVAAAGAGAGGLPGGWPAADIVLTGVDRAVALGRGWEMGITLFEGRLFRG
jgi:hypothetical protein